MKHIIAWGFAAVLLIISLLTTFFSKATLGLALIWGAAVLAVLYAVFQKQVSAFCKKGIGRVLKYIFFILAALFAGMFIFVAVSGYGNQVTGSEPVILILGSGLDGDQPGQVLQRRLDAGAAAWQQNPDAVILVSGGKGSDEKVSEAQAMQSYLLAAGVPSDKIWLEDQSTSTEENMLFSKELLAQHGFDTDTPIVVVTNAFHQYRSGRYAAKAGLTNIHRLPASMPLLEAVPAYAREVFTILLLWLAG